jgi:hypothetical protein
VEDGRGRPTVTVVIGSNGAEEAAERCLTALEPQRSGTQVILCEPRRTSAGLRERFAWAEFIERPGALVPELWTAGIDRATAPIVALTISPMAPAPDWIETIRERLDEHDAVAGAIDPGSGLRRADWGEYLCRYAKDMRPFQPHHCVDLPGDNAAYRRELLEGKRELYRDGFWEPVVNRQLAGEGASLWHDPKVVVHQGRSAGWRAFAAQRLHHGTAHGRQRGARFGRLRNLAGVLGAPLVPGLLTLRILRIVIRRRRARGHFLLALPFIALFNVAWAVGEAAGHAEALRRRMPAG